MRIVYLSPLGALGGAERSLLNMIRTIRNVESNWELHLIAAEQGPLLTAAENLGAHVHCLPMPDNLMSAGSGGLSVLRATGMAWSMLSYAWSLRKLLRSLEPDLVHSNGVKFHLLSSLSMPRRCPLVWHIHEYFSSKGRAARLLQLAARRSCGLIGVSQDVLVDAQCVLGAKVGQVVYNAIDTDHFAPAPRSHVSEKLRVGLLGTFAHWKGHDVFLAAAALLLKEPNCPLVEFEIVGGPIYRTQSSQFTLEELTSMAERLGIRDHVTFVPFMSDPLAAYRSFDVVVHASTAPEAFGLTIAEAMACGKPLVTTALGGSAELTTPEVDCLVSEAGSPESLATAIRRLLVDPDRRHRLGARARETALSRLSLSQFGPALIAAYQRFISCSSP